MPTRYSPMTMRALERSLSEVLGNQRLILHALFHLLHKGNQTMALLDALEQEVKSMSGTVDSAVELIRGLRQQIIDAGTDPVKLAELVEQLRVKEQALADAVVVTP